MDEVNDVVMWCFCDMVVDKSEETNLRVTGSDLACDCDPFFLTFRTPWLKGFCPLHEAHQHPPTTDPKANTKAKLATKPSSPTKKRKAETQQGQASRTSQEDNSY
jgi:hypothetical protein